MLAMAPTSRGAKKSGRFEIKWKEHRMVTSKVNGNVRILVGKWKILLNKILYS